MEARDTVSSWERIRMISAKCRKAGVEGMFETEAQRLDQAEISFKLGMEAERKFILKNTDRDKRARLEGIRKVVEWIEIRRSRYVKDFCITGREWQAFKESRGIK